MLEEIEGIIYTWLYIAQAKFTKLNAMLSRAYIAVFCNILTRKNNPIPNSLSESKHL